MKKKFNPSKRHLDEQPLSDIIKQIIEGYPLEKNLDNTRIQEIWGKIMGTGVDNYTQSIYLQKNTLFVKLTSSVLRNELSYGKSKIISMLNEELNKNIIKDLKLI